MKKTPILFMCIIFISLFLSSCGNVKNSIDKNGLSSGNTNNISIAESPTRILFGKYQMLYYYDKVNHETSPFCFDPLCQHDNESCIAIRFPKYNSESTYSEFSGSIEYCSYNDRFYATRGDQICSFRFDGTDFKTEFYFSEDGNDFSSSLYNTRLIKNMHIYNSYLYMQKLDAVSGEYFLLRYDLKTGIYENLCETSGYNDSNVWHYIITDKGLLIKLETKKDGIFCIKTDFEMQNVEKLDDKLNDAISSTADTIIDGEYIYYIKSPGLVRVNFNTFEEEVVLEDGKQTDDSTYTIGGETFTMKGTFNGPRLLCTGEKQIYVIKRNTEPIRLGIKIDQRTKMISEVNTSTYSITAIDKKSFKETTILSDQYLQFNKCYISNNKKMAILMFNRLVFENEEIDGKTEAVLKKSISEIYSYDIDKDGLFVNETMFWDENLWND